MYFIELASGESFPCAPEQTILDAAKDASVVLPHSCLQGRCDTCSAELVKGKALQGDLEFSAESQTNILTCASIPQSDIKLSSMSLKVDMPACKTIPCKIDSREFVTKDIVKLTLRFPPSYSFVYLPGQYVDLIIPSGQARSYSIADFDCKGNKLSLFIKYVEGGILSEFIFGESDFSRVMRIRGPSGTFFFDGNEEDTVVFLATGTGIAPIISILNSLEMDRFKGSIYLVWGNRTLVDFFWSPEYEYLNLEFFKACSRETNWQGYRYVHDFFNDFEQKECNLGVYACGSTAMITQAKQVIDELVCSTTTFKSDAFVASGSS